MLPVEAASGFQSRLDNAIDQEIARLEEQMEQLKSFKGLGPEIATVMERVQEVFGERGVIWLIRPNQVLQAIPLHLIRQGKTDRVLRLLGQIEHGIPP
jgi:LPS sulfotransferase NodH